MTSAPQYPTETPEGADGTGGEKGTLVFTDKLGAYMKVTGTPRLVFANQQFEGKTTDGGKTYIFEGSIDANEIYPGAASLEYMTLEVSTDQNGQQTLTWTIPAALLPLRTLTANQQYRLHRSYKPYNPAGSGCLPHPPVLLGGPG